MICFIDIETEGNPEAIQFLPEPQAPANYKDPEKIKAYIDEKRKAQVEKAALDFDFGKIVSASVRIGEHLQTRGWLVNEKRSEADLLRILWRCIDYARGIVCGYNILEFDLPYILRRSFALEVRPPTFPDLRRYHTYPVIDLMQVLAYWNPSHYISLKMACKLYGIENPMEGLDGSQVASMDDATKLAYNKNDVDLVVALFQRMKPYYPIG